MLPKPVEILQEHFADLPDPRQLRSEDHPLINILFIAVCAVLCGAEHFTEMEAFGQAKEPWLCQHLDLCRGIPSHDTFNRVFRLLDPEAFGRCFVSWSRALAELTAGEVVALDGKSVRRAFDKAVGEDKPLHLVSAFAVANGLCLGQRKVASKENEIVAVPKLLEVLALAGCIVTLDAMGCQKKIAKAIREHEADYVLRLKDNHPVVRQEVEAFFDDCLAHAPESLAFDEQVDGGHGRVEVRRLWSSGNVEWFTDLDKWQDLSSLVLVESERHIGEQISVERRLYLSSLPASDTSMLQRAIRAHWGIENSLHWVLDVAMREDESRARKDHVGENLALLRKMTLNMLKQDTSVPGGIHAKRLRAGWDTNYLARLLVQPVSG
jgi:predicted transposase YbfD/YdcC